MSTGEKVPTDKSTQKADPKSADAVAAAATQGLSIVARTQGQLVRRRFFRHRAAMISLAILTFVILLAYTSIGFAGIPGWWIWNYYTPGKVVNRGAPTLSLWPTFLGGDGFAIGLHPFGQDDLGRDYFALVMRGTQISIVIAFVVGIVSTLIGVTIGALSGFYRGKTEAVLMRFTDVIITIPLLVIAAVLGQKFGGSGPLVLALVIGLVTWTGLARLVRGEFLSLREKEFVEAARALGAKPNRIIFKHILPNTVGVITVVGHAGHRQRDPAGNRAVLPGFRCASAGYLTRPAGLDLSERVRHPAMAVLVARLVHHHHRVVRQLHR